MIFGRKPYFGTPGINPDAPYPGKPMDDEGFSSGIAGAVNQKKRGLGGFLQDVLAASVIGAPQFLAMRYQQRDDERNAEVKEAAYRRQKEDEAARDAREFEQSKQLVDYSANRRPPTSIQQNYEFLKATNPQLAEQYLGAQANPYQWITADNGDGTKSIIPIPRGGTGVGNIPQQPSGPQSYVDPFKAPGNVTSGRRTEYGNRLVGGKPDSRHLSGDAADHTGASMAELRKYYGPGAKLIDEGDHIHAEQAGYGKVPLHGKRGTLQGPRSSQAKRLSNGKMAYFVNGKWYDNPEGR